MPYVKSTLTYKSLIYTRNWFWCHFSVLNIKNYSLNSYWSLCQPTCKQEGVHKAGPGGYCRILKHIIKIFPAEITLRRHTDMLPSHCLSLSLLPETSPQLFLLLSILRSTFLPLELSFKYRPPASQWSWPLSYSHQIKTHFTLKQSGPRNFNGHGIQKVIVC